MVREFPFGTEFRPDFVTLGPFSGAFEIHFIEMEPPSARLFNSDGTMAKHLNRAVRQINAWQTFLEKNRPTVLRDMSRFFAERELVWHRGSEPTCSAGWSLTHPRMTFHWNYDIVIGRRDNLSAIDIERKAAFRKNQGIEVMTYDRLLEACQKYDKQTGLP